MRKHEEADKTLNDSGTIEHRKRNILFIVLLVTPGALLAIDEILWGIYPPGWRLLLELVLIVYFLVATVGSFVFLFFKIRKNIVLAFLPIILNAFLFYAFFNLDLQAYSRNHDFRRNLEAREEVVEMVMSGKLKWIKGYNFVKPPDKHKHLSRWGTQGGVYVSQEKDVIFFATKYGSLGGHSGFIYTEEKNPPVPDFDGMIDEDDERIKMEDHWTWIEH